MITASDEKIKRIYNAMADRRSRTVFTNRLMFNMTRAPEFLYNIIVTDAAARELFSEVKGRTAAIFGAGVYGKAVFGFADADWRCFIDNYSCGRKINGIPVISLREFSEKYDDGKMPIAVTPMKPNADICKQLNDCGISGERIINFGRFVEDCENRQYFDFFTADKNTRESFVDAGALDGASSYRFAAWCKGSYEKIWAFEPDPLNFRLCGENCLLNNFYTYKSGLADKKGTLYFSAINNECSRVADSGNIKVDVTDLDSVLKNERVTFIKMDIEGSEYSALCGARNIICSQKPRLAVCVYHKPEDLLDISSLILDMVPEYRLGMRHYTLWESETVLYAY